MQEKKRKIIENILILEISKISHSVYVSIFYWPNWVCLSTFGSPIKNIVLAGSLLRSNEPKRIRLPRKPKENLNFLPMGLELRLN